MTMIRELIVGQPMSLFEKDLIGCDRPNCCLRI